MSKAFPVIGPRFAVPPASGAATDFLEMRRVGTYPNQLLLAGLACYVETQVDKKESFDLKGLWKQGSDRSITEEFEREIEQRQREGPDNEGLQDLLVRVGLWMDERDAWQVSSTGQAIASLQRLQEALDVNISLFSSTQDFPAINLGTVLLSHHSSQTRARLTLCICEDVIFLLYPYISPSNCVRLACGHHIFKHLIYAQVSERVGDFTVSEQDLAVLRVNCLTCFQTSTVRLKPQGTKFVFEGTYLPDEKNCEHHVAPMERFRCQCNAYQCKECALSRALTVSGPSCRQCGTSYLDDIDSLVCTKQYNWLRPYLSIITRNRPTRDLSSLPNSTFNHLQNSGPCLTPFSSFHSTSACEICHQEVTLDSPCPNHDCCLKCLIAAICESFDKYECPVCKVNVKKFYEENRKCSKCKKPYHREEMFFLCASCRMQVCPKCVKKNKDAYSKCSVTGRVHKVYGDKVDKILGPNSTSFR